MPSSTRDMPTAKRPTKKPGATRFHRMAVREGGIARDEAVKNVQRFLDQLKPKYLEWLRADMALLESSVDALAADSSSGDEWKKIYRQSCVIRDLGASFGYRSVTDVADSLCELIQRLEASGTEHMPSIETHVLALRLVGSVDSDALTASADHRLIDGLKAIVAMFPKAGEK